MMNRLLHELRRRNVFRVGLAYLVGAWLIAQVVANVGPILGLPAAFGKGVLLVLALGFPAALVFSWLYELTPEGIKKTADVPEAESIASKTGRKFDHAILAGLALVGVMIVADRLMPEAPAAASASPDQGAKAAIPDASIAVLPFADLSPGKDQEYFSDGMTEEILNVLVQIDGLTVASRTSAFAFRNATEKASAIAATLNVKYLLEGSVRRDGERLRITAQLIDAAKDRHLWSETYDRTMADVFAIQEEIATAIGGELRAKLGGAGGPAPAPARTENLEAYDKYLMARSLLKKRGAGLREAIALFKEVVSEDPGYAPAWSGLVQAVEPVIFYLPETQDPFVLAEYQGLEALAARMAVDRDPKSAEALGGMADYLRDQLQWEAAEDYYRRALAEDANDVEVIEDFQEFLHRVGRTEEALEEARRALTIEPLWPLLKDWEAIHLGQLGDRARAGALARATFERSPDYTGAINTAFILALTDGRHDDARRFADAASESAVISKDAMRRLLDWSGHGRSPEAARALPGLVLTDWLSMLAAAGAEDRVFEILAKTDPRINSMALLRIAGHERLRCDPRLKREIIRAELPQYWRRRGWPKFFKPAGDGDFGCE